MSETTPEYKVKQAWQKPRIRIIKGAVCRWWRKAYQLAEYYNKIIKLIEKDGSIERI